MSEFVPNGRRAWIVAGLLFLYSVVNFIDKLVMGLAAVPIMKEFGLKPAQYGALGSSFSSAARAFSNLPCCRN